MTRPVTGSRILPSTWKRMQSVHGRWSSTSHQIPWTSSFRHAYPYAANSSNSLQGWQIGMDCRPQSNINSAPAPQRPQTLVASRRSCCCCARRPCGFIASIGTPLIHQLHHCAFGPSPMHLRATASRSPGFRDECARYRPESPSPSGLCPRTHLPTLAVAQGCSNRQQP